MEIVNRRQKNDQTEYSVSDFFYSEYARCAQAIVVLLQCEEPKMTAVWINGKEAEEEQITENPKGFYAELTASDTMQYEGSLLGKKITLCFFRNHPSQYTFTGEPVDFLEELKEGIRSVFPIKEEQELLEIGVNFAYGKMVVNKKVMLEKGMTYSQFQSSFLYGEILSSQDGNILLKRPAHMLKNDWVVSLRFDKERLQVVQCRLIVAGEAEGRYCGLNEDERSQAFDYLCSLLDSYVKSEGQIQTAEDMKLYVKEKTNMLVFKDDQQQCVGLTMFF